MVLVHKTALDQACRSVALDNYGYLDAGNRNLRERINQNYKDHEEVSSKRRYRETVDREDIQDRFEKLSQEYEDVIYDPDKRPNVFFFIPVEFSEHDDDALLKDVAECFHSIPIRTEEQIRKNLDMVVSKSDFELLIAELTAESWIDLEFSSEETDYYTAGEEVMNSDYGDSIPSVESLLESNTEDGVVTPSDIKDALNIQATNKLIEYLVENDNLYDLGEEYVVTTEECIKTYVKDLIDQPFVQSIEDEFEDANLLLSRTEFTSKVESEIKERSDLLDIDVDIDLITTTTENLLQSDFQLILEEKTFSTKGTAEDFLIWKEKVSGFVTDQAEKVINAEANGELPPDEKSFVEDVQSSIKDRDFSGTRLGSGARTEHYRDLISTEVEEIAKRGDLRDVIKEK